MAQTNNASRKMRVYTVACLFYFQNVILLNISGITLETLYIINFSYYQNGMHSTNKSKAYVIFTF